VLHDVDKYAASEMKEVAREALKELRELLVEV